MAIGQYEHQRKPLAERFAAKVREGTGGECWLWSGSTIKGYGNIREGGKRGRMLKAHRVAWMLARGPVPDGLNVLHKCDNRRCVNVAHLFLGTNADNIADAIRKGRHTHGEKVWTARLTPDEVRQIRRLSSEGLTQNRIAARFGVTRSAVKAITSGVVWRHVEGR